MRLTSNNFKNISKATLLSTLLSTATGTFANDVKSITEKAGVENLPTLSEDKSINNDLKRILELNKCIIKKYDDKSMEFCTNSEEDYVLFNGKIYQEFNPNEISSYSGETIMPEICVKINSKKGILPFEVCVGEFVLTESGYLEAQNDGYGEITFQGSHETAEQAKKRLIGLGYASEYIDDILESARTWYPPESEVEK